jgi:tetratricopeptide (TPR) repeat protein/class 3 adenylate cyclase
VLYEMLAGVRPFKGAGEQALLVATLSADPEPLSTHRADVPPSVEAVIRRALAKDPNSRFATATEFAQALLAGISGANSAVVPPVPAKDDDDGLLARAGERRQVTMVAAHIAGHDVIVERLSPERADAVMARLRDIAHEVATHQGGIVNHFGSDGFTLLFGVPTAHEDDPARGARAALALHARVAEVAATLDPRLASTLRLSSGVHVGLVVAQRLREGDRRYRISGVPADVAQRLASQADVDEILVTPEMRRLIAAYTILEDAATVRLPGVSTPVALARVLGASETRTRLDGAMRTGLTPFVGREKERASLAEQWVSARTGTGCVSVLLGEAGAGKSRLLHELRELVHREGGRVLTGRCDPYGSSTPFLPFADAAQDALGLVRGSKSDRHEAVVRAVRSLDAGLEEFLPFYLALLAVPSDAHPVPAHLQGERFQAAMLSAVAALFTAGTLAGPALLLLEDWHWADDASREALRQLVEIAPTVALLLIVTSRPDASIAWGTSEHQTLLHLPPLDNAATEGIARAVFQAERVDAALLTHLHERTGGNPFFLEEVCEALLEDGSVVVRNGVAVTTASAEGLHVPETVQGVLRTRIDRLDGDAREVLRVASVIGRVFPRGVLEDVIAPRVNLPKALERLKASGLVQQVRVIPEPAYRFKHALTEEVAYDSLLEHQRAFLHASVGHAIEKRYAAQLDEQVERLTHHFSRAEAWPEAVRYGLQGADRATILCQYGEAMAAMERVQDWIAHLPDDEGKRDIVADALLRQERLCESLGLRVRQLEIVELLIGLLAPSGSSERLAQAYLRQGDAFTLRRRYAAAEDALKNSLRVASELGDATGERNALRSIALLRSHEARHEEALEIIEEVIRLGREAADLRAEAGDLATMANVLRAMGRHQQALDVIREAIEQGHVDERSLRYGALLNVMATVYRDLGDYDQALHYYQRTATMLNDTVYASFSLPGIAFVQLQQGKVEEALASYREAVDLNRKARYADGSAHACRSLGEVLVGLGRDAEAVPHLREAAALFRQLEDQENETLMWRRLAAAYAGMATAARTGAPGRTGDHVGALYVDGVAAAVRAGDVDRELELRNAFGIWHWEQGAFDQAVSQFDAGLRLCLQKADRVHEGLMRNSLGASFLRLHRLDEAAAMLQDAIRVNTDTNERQLHVHSLLTMTRVLLAQGKVEQASSTCAEAITVAGAVADETLLGAAQRLQQDVARIATHASHVADHPVL